MLQPFIPQTDEEILKERLKKQTSLSWKICSPLIIVCILALGPVWAVWRGKAPGEILDDSFFAMFLVSLTFQIALLIWVGIWRLLKPEQSPKAGLLCFWLNILFTVGWLVPIGLLAVNEKIVAFFILVFLWIGLIIDITPINRLIIACRHPYSRLTQKKSSPCPMVFHFWDMTKTFFWAPFLMAVLCAGTVIIISYCTHRFTSRVFLYAWIAGGIFALPGIAIFWPMSISALLLKQTSSPSAFQRIVRPIAWFFILPPRGKIFPPE